MTPMRNFLAFLTTISLTIGCQNWSYVKTVGYHSDTLWDVRMFVKDVQECIEVCSKQKVCNGFNFEIKTGFCYLHQSSTNFTTIENKSYTQYEKICLQSDKLVKICNHTIERIPQKILVGLATRVVSAKNLESCIQNCADSEKEYDERCRSGMFYAANDIHENCILSSDSAKGYPDYLSDENNDIVDYFELDCNKNETQDRFKRDVTNVPKSRHRNVLKLNSQDWGSWTRCDGTGGNRYRYRQCKSPNPNSCQKDTAPCDPTNRQQESQDIQGEEGESLNGNGNGNAMQFITDQNGVTPNNVQPVTDSGNGNSATNGGNLPAPVDGSSGMVVPISGSGAMVPPTSGSGGMVQPVTGPGGMVKPPHRSGGIVNPSGGSNGRVEPATGPRGMGPPRSGGTGQTYPVPGGTGQTYPVPGGTGQTYPVPGGGQTYPAPGGTGQAYTGSGGMVPPPTDSVVQPMPTTMAPAPPMPTSMAPPIPAPMPTTMGPAPPVPMPTTMAPAAFAQTDAPAPVMVTGGVSEPNFVFVQGNPKGVHNNTGQQMNSGGNAQNNAVNQSGQNGGNTDGTKHHGHRNNNGAQEVELMPSSSNHASP